MTAVLLAAAVPLALATSSGAAAPTQAAGAGHPLDDDGGPLNTLDEDPGGFFLMSEGGATDTASRQG